MRLILIGKYGLVTLTQYCEFNSENDKKANSLEAAKPLPHTHYKPRYRLGKNNTAATYVLCNPCIDYFASHTLTILTL